VELKKFYPGFLDLFNFLDVLEITFMEFATRKVGLVMEITSTEIRMNALVGKRAGVFMDAKTMQPLLTPEGGLDYVPWQLTGSKEWLVRTSLSLRLPFLLVPLVLPPAEYLVTHLGKTEPGTNKLVSIEEVVTLYSMEKSGKEWAINWIIPIERMRTLLLETFQLTLSCSKVESTEEAAPLWKLGIDTELQMPNLPGVLSRVMKLFMRESAIDMICFFRDFLIALAEDLDRLVSQPFSSSR
jgi:hypothetical protein